MKSGRQSHCAVGRKYVTGKSSDTTGNRSRDRPRLVSQRLNHYTTPGFLLHSYNIGIIWLITLGRERNRPWFLGIFNFRKKEEKIWFEPVLNILTPLSPTLTNFYLPLFKTLAQLLPSPPPKKNLFLGSKNIAGAFTLLNPPPQLRLRILTLSHQSCVVIFHLFTIDVV